MKPITSVVTILLASTLPATAQQDSLESVPGGAAAQAASPLGAWERDSLSAASRSGLEELRAAALGSGSGLDEVERSSLRDLQRRHAGLDQMRAGELTLSDDDVKLILITAGVVILIALIL